MRRDWRAAVGAVTLISGIFLAREGLRLFWEDTLPNDMPTPAHDRYAWMALQSCWTGWHTKGQSLVWEESCHQHPDGIEYFATGLLIVTLTLLVWIWWKPLKK